MKYEGAVILVMLIAHNSSTAMALGELNKNNSRLSKDLEKVSSGMKINNTDAMGLKGVAVDPIEKALEALGKLDAALEYALNENVRMGSY